MSTSIGKFKVSVSAVLENGKTFGNDVDKGLRGATVAAGALTVALGGTVKVAANFEQGMSNIKAVAGASDKQINALRETAIRLGSETAFSSTEAAAAIEELVKAGVPVKDVLNGAADASVNLAAATGITVPESATLMSNAMNQFGLKAKDLEGVTDRIAGAANASAIDAGQFGYALAQAGASANLAGVTFDDLAVAIAEMGQAGIVGSDAGTSLKTFLSRLNPTTKEATGLMKQLGIITKDGTNQFYDAEGKLKSFDQIQGILAKSTKDLTAQEKQYYLGKIFGSDALRAAAVLSEQGAEGFNKMDKAMAKTTAADAAKTRQDNLNNSLEQLKGSLEALAISLGTILIPTIRTMADGLTGLVNVFSGLPDGVKKSLVIGTALFTAFLVGALAITKVIMIIKEFQAAMVALRAGLAATRLSFIATWIAAAGPILIIIAIIAIVIGIIVLLWKKSDAFRAGVMAIWDAMKDAWAWIKDAWSKFIGWIKAGWDAFKAGLAYIRDFWKQAFTSMFEWIKGKWEAFKAGLAYIKTFWVNTFNSMINWLKSHWPIILAVLTGPIGLLVLVIVKNWAKIKAAFSAGLNFIKNLWMMQFNLIKGAFTTVINWIKTGIDKMVGFFSSMKSRVTSALSGVFNGLTSAARSAFNAVASLWNNTVGRISFEAPDWVPGMGGKGWSVPDIPLMAEGGIVDRATLAVIGEAGPEAVIPLGKLSATLASAHHEGAMSRADSGGGKKVEQHFTVPAPKTNTDFYLAAKRGARAAMA